MNKVLYAREGAKSIMDRTFADIPWQVRVEVDGVEVEVPEVRTLKSLVLKHYQIVPIFSFFGNSSQMFNSTGKHFSFWV